MHMLDADFQETKFIQINFRKNIWKRGLKQGDYAS